MKKDNDIKIHKDKEVKEILDKYSINYSIDLDEEITLNILKQYLPTKRKNNKFLTIKSLLRISLSELFFECKYQYGIMTLILILLLPILNLSISPYLLIFFTAPIPFFIGFRNIYGRTDNVIIELEKTFKFSYYQMLCSRIVTLTYISILFLSLSLGYFVISGVNVESLSIFKLIVLGLTPIFIFASYLLFITSTNRDNNLFTISLYIWGLFGFAAVSTDIGHFIFNLHVLVYILIIVISIVFFIINMIKILKTQAREATDI